MGLLFVVAVVAGSIAVLDFDQRHPVAVTGAVPPAAASTALVDEPVPPRARSVALTPVSQALPISQGLVGVIPVPLAPMAVAGPIPLLAWRAYHRAAARSGCRLPWYLLAGIGKIESDHGRFHGARFDVTGKVHPAIRGPGTVYGRAMGPMQFIPPTWAVYAADGNGDHRADPQNIFDATDAAAHYLCVAGGADLSQPASQRRAVFAYNHLKSYVQDVLAFAAAYRHGRPESSVHLVPIVNPKPVRHHAHRPAGTSRTEGRHPSTTSSPAPTATLTHPGPAPTCASSSGTVTPTGSVSPSAYPSGSATADPSTTGTGTPVLTTTDPATTAIPTATGPTSSTMPTATPTPSTSVPPSDTGSTCPATATP